MKCIDLYAVVLLLVLVSSCGQSQTDSSKDTARSETKDTVSSYWPDTLQVHTIKKGRNGTILIAGNRTAVSSSPGAVFRYDGKSFTNLTSKMGSHNFSDVLEDQHGNIWFAAADGLYYYDGKSFQQVTTRQGLINDTVRCIYEDKAGIIWFGTKGGISRYDGKSFRNFPVKGGDHWNDVITTFMEDKTGKLWIGTRTVVYMYDGKTFTPLINKNGRSVMDIFSIAEDRKGNIWLGGYEGLHRYDGKTFTHYTHNRFTYVLSVIEDKQGNIWTIGKINTNGELALSRYDQNSLYNKKPMVTEIMSGASPFRALLEDKDGSIWFGYASGLYRYDGKTIRQFSSNEGLK
jgi:ligand-binding sensor domain-containing protein